MRAYAIHDTDGGRVQPFPLLKHIYCTEREAKEAAERKGFDPQWYPVLPVEIKAVTCEVEE